MKVLITDRLPAISRDAAASQAWHRDTSAVATANAFSPDADMHALPVPPHGPCEMFPLSCKIID